MAKSRDSRGGAIHVVCVRVRACVCVRVRVSACVWGGGGGWVGQVHVRVAGMHVCVGGR